MRLFLLLALAILAIGAAEAKPQKVKCGKFIYYEGEVANKKPKGNGTLFVVSPFEQNEFVATISGNFDASSIYNAEINSTILPNIALSGSQPLTFTISYTDGSIKSETIDFDFSKAKFEKDSIIYSFPELCASLTLEKSKLYHEFSQNGKKIDTLKNIYIIELSVENFPAPEWVSLYWNNPTAIGSASFLKDGNFEVSNDIVYIFGNYCYSKTKNEFFLTNDVDKTFRIGQDGKSWSGTRMLVDGTKIDGDEKQVNLEVANFKYSGSLIDPMAPAKQSMTSWSSDMFKTGTQTYDNRITKYLNGETDYIIKERLKAQNIDDDIIDKLISENITEAQAFAEQTIRNEELAQQRQEAAEILNARWNCSEIAFIGPIEGNGEGDSAFRMIFNLDHTYLAGQVMMALNSNKEGILTIVTEPGQKAMSLSRGRALQVVDVCKKLNKTIKGKWDIDGDDILIDGKKVATIGKGGQTILYEGMINSTMKIEAKR